MPGDGPSRQYHAEPLLSEASLNEFVLGVWSVAKPGRQPCVPRDRQTTAGQAHIAVTSHELPALTGKVCNPHPIPNEGLLVFRRDRSNPLNNLRLPVLNWLHHRAYVGRIERKDILRLRDNGVSGRTPESVVPYGSKGKRLLLYPIESKSRFFHDLAGAIGRTRVDRHILDLAANILCAQSFNDTTKCIASIIRQEHN